MNTENPFQELNYEDSFRLKDRTISFSELYEEDGCKFAYLDCVNDEAQIRVKLEFDNPNPSSLTLRFYIKSYSEEKIAEIKSYIIKTYTNENMNISDDGIIHFDEISEVARSLISVLKEVNL